MTEEELDAAVDVIAAVDAGVLQSLNQRPKARNKSYAQRAREELRGHNRITKRSALPTQRLNGRQKEPRSQRHMDRRRWQAPRC